MIGEVIYIKVSDIK